jgi:hypothetical protein
MSGIAEIFRGIGVLLIDLAQRGMHPASPYRAIVLRNRLARGKW